MNHVYLWANLSVLNWELHAAERFRDHNATHNQLGYLVRWPLWEDVREAAEDAEEWEQE